MLLSQNIKFLLLFTRALSQRIKKINHEFCVLKQIKNYKKFFNNERIEILFKQHDKSHAINLIKSKNSSFMVLYNLLQNKLAKLRRYFNNVLIKE